MSDCKWRRSYTFPTIQDFYSIPSKLSLDQKPRNMVQLAHRTWLNRLTPAISGETPVNSAKHRQEPLVRLAGVDKFFGEQHVLRDICLEIFAGEVVFIVGPSGSGKSTLCRCVNRLETISSGTITINATPLPEEGRALARLRAEVGMVFQSFNLFAHKTALQNVTLGPVKVRGVPRAEAEARGRELLQRVGLTAKVDAYPSQLSGGQQQRVAIARSLAMNPKIILF